MTQYRQSNTHSLVNRIFSRLIQRPSAEKLWQIPAAILFPTPRPPFFLSVPLEVHATSYFAASDKIFNFSCKLICSRTTISDTSFRTYVFLYHISNVRSCQVEKYINSMPVLFTVTCQATQKAIFFSLDTFNLALLCSFPNLFVLTLFCSSTNNFLSIFVYSTPFTLSYKQFSAILFVSMLYTNIINNFLFIPSEIFSFINNPSLNRILRFFREYFQSVPA